MSGTVHPKTLRMLLAAAVVGLVLVLDSLGLFAGLDAFLYEASFQLRKDRPVDDSILIVAVDERTLDRFGRWPVSRSHYARLLQKLGQARAVGFDILFSEPSEDDRRFARAIERHGRVVLPAYIDRRHRIHYPVPVLANASVGHVHIDEAFGEGITRVFRRIRFDEAELPSLSSAMEREASKGNVAAPGSRPAVSRGSKVSAIRGLKPMNVNFRGPPYSYPYFSLQEVLEGGLPPAFFRDKVVLVGATAAGTGERVRTPFGTEHNRMPGVEVHAHAVDNLLHGDWIRIANRPAGWALAAALALLIFFAAGGLKTPWGILAPLGGIVAALAVHHAALVGADLWIRPGAALGALIGMGILIYIAGLQDAKAEVEASRREWKDSFDVIRDAITITDSGFRTVLSNRAAEDPVQRRLQAYLRRDILRTEEPGTPLESSGSPLLRDLRQGTAASLELGDPDSDRVFEVSLFPRFDGRSRFTGCVQVMREITERKEFEERQRHLERQLVQAQKMEAIGTLAGGIAHDFNNILYALMGHTELAMLALDDPSEAREHLDEVLQAGHRAAGLVNQILAFSRDGENEHMAMDLAPIVKEALKLLRASIPASIEIRQEIGNETGTVEADPSQIHQVLMNLCTNAYHAMQEKGGRMEVKLTRVNLTRDDVPAAVQLHPGPYVKLSVADTGEGIHLQHLDRIFEPYFTTKPMGDGTGLGLAVVHGIVQAHGGTVKVDSQPGRGTRFDVYFPVVDRTPAPETSVPLLETVGNERLLMVDDEARALHAAREMLERLHYRVTATTDSREALELFRNRPDRFDLVVTDLTMPGLTGRELVRELLKIRPDTPIILCTGFTQRITEQEARAMGTRALVAKPLSLTKLAQIVREVLDRPE
jgi:signal transduction histidine kinase